MDSSKITEPLDVDEIELNKPTKNPLICWNCRQNGHMFMDCPSTERTLFCYRCGEPEVKAPNCSNCKSKNYIRNEGTAWNRRSNETPSAMQLLKK